MYWSCTHGVCDDALGSMRGLPTLVPRMLSMPGLLSSLAPDSTMRSTEALVLTSASSLALAFAFLLMFFQKKVRASYKSHLERAAPRSVVVRSLHGAAVASLVTV